MNEDLALVGALIEALAMEDGEEKSAALMTVAEAVAGRAGAEPAEDEPAEDEPPTPPEETA